MDKIAITEWSSIAANHDGLCCSDRLFDIAGFEPVLLSGIVRPDAGIAIGLEFEGDREPIIITGLLHLVHRAGQILNMVAKLVSNDICLGKVAGSFEFTAELVKKGKVEVQLIIARTIERTGRRRRVAAS